jgi:DNA-binding GntR family transcriptional regulator
MRRSRVAEKSAVEPASQLSDTLFKGDMVQDPARNTLQLRAYRTLSRNLMMGRYMPGDTVSLRTIAVQLGTSPMPVRGAINRLIAEQALVLLPNRTVIVPWMTRSRFTELFRVRQVLEGMVTASACERMTPTLLQKLTKINNSIKQNITDGNIRQMLSQNLNFHLSLYEAADAEVTYPLIEMLWRQAGPFVAMTPRMNGVAWTAKFHDDILRALSDRKPALARKAAEQDIDETLQQILKHANLENPQAGSHPRFADG